MPVKRTVTTNVKLAPKPVVEVPTRQGDRKNNKEDVRREAPKEELVSVEGKEGAEMVLKKTKKVCSFCTKKEEPRYWDLSSIRRYMNDRSRIYPRTRSGLCAKHQRRVTKQIKYARHLSMLPFTASI